MPGLKGEKLQGVEWNGEGGSLNNLLKEDADGHFSEVQITPYVSAFPQIWDLSVAAPKHPEAILRCKLAALCRILALNGWASKFISVSGKLSSTDTESFLINPGGLLLSEISASTFFKLDYQGKTLVPGSASGFVPDPFSVHFHSALLQSREGMNCALFIDSQPVQAVSVMKKGLLPLSQQACLLGDIATHDSPLYPNLDENDEEQKSKLLASFGSVAKVLLLRNQGAFVIAERVEEALYIVKNLIAACQIQTNVLKAVSGDISQLSTPSDTCIEAYRLAARKFNKVTAEETVAWQRKQDAMLEWDAQMRQLDGMGLHTGYGQPLVKKIASSTNRSRVEVPATALSYLTQQPYESRAPEKKPDSASSKWLYSPNVYVKQESEVNGKKKIINWSKSEEGYTATKVSENPHLFSGKTVNPQELIDKQKQLKHKRETDETSTGPTANILYGVTWVEADALNEADSGMAVKGPAMQRAQATIYEDCENPFNAVSGDELENYKINIQRQQQGLPPLKQKEIAKSTSHPKKSPSTRSDTSYHKAQPAAHVSESAPESPRAVETAVVEKEEKKKKKTLPFKLRASKKKEHGH